MLDNIDLGYDPAGYAGPFDEAEMRAFEAWLQRCENERIKFDPDYVEHLRIHHGGSPKSRYFKTATGTDHVVVRFLNFLPGSFKGPLAQYGVEGTWGLIDDRLGKNLIPFAELFAGDMLCFDYSGEGRPSVVVWFHERSRPGKPYTEKVAQDFPGLLAVLRPE